MTNTSGDAMPADVTTRPDAAGGRWWSTRHEWRSFFELFAMCGVAIAQRVFSVFSNDPTSFIAVRAGAADIIVFTIAVLLGPPLGMWALERIIGLVGAGARRRVHLGLIGLLVIMFAVGAVRGPLGPVLGIAAAAGAILLARRSDVVHSFLTFLAFAPPVFAVLFVFFSPVSAVAFPTDPPQVHVTMGDDRPPVVMVILDELPLNSLLDGQGRIDPEAFPNLAELETTSTFARNHTTLSSSTPVAVPTILSGLVPHDAGKLPVASGYPRTLFTMLAGSYEIRAAEHITKLCPSSSCEVPEPSGESGRAPAWQLLKQAKSVFTSPAVFFNIGFDDADPQDSFDWIVSGDQPDRDRPTFEYVHAMVPHQPWRFTPDGRRYDAPSPPLQYSDPRQDVAPAGLARQQHLMQVAYADRLVGMVIDHLREQGRFDETLLVVTADHGVSFRPGQPRRPLGTENSSDIAWVPLLIKAPGQTEARVIDAPTSAVDVLPTLMDILGVRSDWRLDGHSIFAKDRPAERDPRILAWVYDKVPPAADGFVHIDGRAGYEQVIRTRAFDAPPGSDLLFWRWGPHADLVGTSVPAGKVSTAAKATATIDDPTRFDAVDLSAPTLPLYVSGSIRGDLPGPVVLALNGRVAAIYDVADVPVVNGVRRFQALLPPQLLTDGRNTLEVFTLGTAGDELERVAPG